MTIVVTSNNPITISMSDDNGVAITEGSILEIQLKSNLKEILAPTYYKVEDMLHAINKLYTIKLDDNLSVVVVSENKFPKDILEAHRDFINKYHPEMIK